jgi:hypothetical protein
MAANDPNPELSIELPNENFTEEELRTAVAKAITPQFVTALHHAHANHERVNMTSVKKLSTTHTHKRK